MNKNVIYIVGATVLLGGGAFLFLKNKKKKDLLKLAEMGGATPSGATPSGTTPSGTTSGGTTKSDALNLANANSLAQERKGVFAKANERTNIGNIIFVKKAKERLVQLDSQLASLGYKVDATGLLVKI